MRILTNEPFLRFDFNGNPKIFTQPIKIITTSQIEEVSHCLHLAENALQAGYYVAGYVSYEAIYALNRSLGMDVPHPPTMPLIWFGVFQQFSKNMSHEKGSYEVSSWRLRETNQSYTETFNRMLEIMNEQKIEQINYSVPFFATFSGDGYAYYEQLKLNQKSSYSAFLQIDHQQILSLSPELFFHLHDDYITVKPMKGTIHRGKSYKEDMQLKLWLESSRKNRLENEMITKLMKEELFSITKEESVRIIDQYQVEKYPTVYQMTSTIQAKLNPHISSIDVLKTLFPCGSVTGIPKQKAIQYIAQFEKNARNVYCGAIGYMTPNGEAVFNVPIRTVIIDHVKGEAIFGSGGAITKHSNAEEEYKEIVTKAKVLQNHMEPFRLLETFGLRDGKTIVLEEHIERLINSAKYFDFQINEQKIREELRLIEDQYIEGNWRIRLVVDQFGYYEMDVQPLIDPDHFNVSLAKRPVQSDNIFLYHKTTNRKIYERHKLENKEAFDILLWNERGEITEFTIGNVVVEMDGTLYTPPIECGLLGGTFREKLLKEGKIYERVIHKDELHKCTNIYFINSVRGWIHVEWIKGE